MQHALVRILTGATLVGSSLITAESVRAQSGVNDAYPASSAARVRGKAQYNSRASYDPPAPANVESARKNGPCSDPWVTIAVEQVYGWANRPWCDVNLYNNGRWASYNELVHAVARVRYPSLEKVEFTGSTFEEKLPSRTDLRLPNRNPLGALENGNLTLDRALITKTDAGGERVTAKGVLLVGSDGSPIAAVIGYNWAGMTEVVDSALTRATLSQYVAPGQPVSTTVKSYTVLKTATRRR